MTTKFTLVAQNGYVTLWFGKSRIGVLRHAALKPEVVATNIGNALRRGETLDPKQWSRSRPINPKSYARCNRIFGF